MSKLCCNGVRMLRQWWADDLLQQRSVIPRLDDSFPDGYGWLPMDGACQIPFADGMVYRLSSTPKDSKSLRDELDRAGESHPVSLRIPADMASYSEHSWWCSAKLTAVTTGWASAIWTESTTQSIITRISPPPRSRSVAVIWAISGSSSNATTKRRGINANRWRDLTPSMTHCRQSRYIRALQAMHT